MSTVENLDIFGLSNQLSSEERLIVSSARSFVASHVQPHIAQHYELGTFPQHLPAQLGELGFLGPQLQGYGCAGVGSRAYGLIMRELERADSGVRSFASVQGSLVMYPIHEFGSEEQKEKFLPQLAQGEMIGAFGLTEPDCGSNPAGMATRAELRGDKWILNGSKTWITNAPICDVAVVWARTSDGIRGFLVEKNAPGFTRMEIKQKLSLRASTTGSFFFKDCEIPKGNLLPKTLGLKSALQCLTQARYGIAWGVLGAAEDCLQEATEYAKQRIMFNKPIASFQLVQAKLANISTQMSLAQLCAFQLAQLKDSGEKQAVQVSMAKQNNVKIALETARMARDVLGANGISLEYRCMRHACNLESVYTYEGTNDIHLLVVGQHLTGISAFA